MKNRLFLILSVCASAIFCGFVAASAAQHAANPVSLDTYAHSDGTVYFEFGLKCPKQKANPQHEVVLLFDTSASQVGPVRREQFAALKSAIAQLPKGTQVQLFSIDLEPVPYTNNFLDVGSADFQKAIAQLESKSVPLGSTNLEKGIGAVFNAFADQNTENVQRTVLYIGDGLNSIGGLPQTKFEQIVGDLVDSRISFSGTAIGVGSQFGLLGILAYRTGGFLVDPGLVAEQFDKGTDSAKIAAEIGSQLGKSVAVPVFWPDDSTVAFSEDWEICPEVLPPIRSDRETLVFGKSNEKMVPAELSVTVEDAKGQSLEQNWSLKPKSAKSENQYLVQLVETAASDKGSSIPFANRALLEQVRNASLIHDDAELGVAEVALLSGQSQSAARIAQQVKSRTDNSNVEASNLLDRATRQMSMDPGFDQEMPVDGPVDAYVKSGSVRLQSLNNTVNVAIANAEKLMVERPDLALQELKLMKAEIMQATDIPPNVRNKIVERIENKMRSAYRQGTIMETRRVEEETIEAERISKALVLDNIFRREEKAKQLMERFNALIAEQQYVQAEMSAEAARPLIPYSQVPGTAAFYAQGNQRINQVDELRILRERAILDNFMLAERISIPLSDEPPMLWPDPEIWNALSERRKDRYDVVDVSNPSESALKIKKALDSTMTYAPEGEESLGQFLESIRDRYGINVDVDRRALEEIEVNADSTIDDVAYTGLPLRIVLKRVLSLLSEDLAYTIEDDILLITSKDNIKADIVKIYQIAELLQTGGGGMGGMGGGMMGGGMGGMGGGMGGGMMGGGMGGMGGGMGGMGGGMMGGMGGMGGGMGGMGGGMMGGMGGGMMSVPSSYDKLLRRSLIQNMQEQGVINSLFAVVDRPQTKTPTPTSKKPQPSQPLKQPQAKKGTSPGMERGGDAEKADTVVVVEPVATSERTSERPLARTNVIELNRVDGTNPEIYWEQVFAVPLEQRPNEAELRYVVLVLFKKAVNGDRVSAKQISTLIESAIRQGEVYPWMYESLAVALNFQGAPLVEVERAVLSAQDFCTNPMDMLLLAVYLEQFGSRSRALEIYKNVASAYPMRPEPYTRGLKLAEELEDEEAIETLTLAVVGQVWEAVWARMVQKSGLDLALTHLEKLRSSGRVEEAERFARLLKEAQRKDCVVIVEYTGDALLDLVVKEPTETYCWHVNPRTTAGGILLNSSESMNSEYGENPGNLKRLVYLCPRGFSGDYEVLVQSSFGKITNNKFRIRVLTNNVEGEPLVSEGYYELGEEGSLVQFTLKEGRLHESLKEAEIEAALVQETALTNRMVLSQQLAAMSNRQVVANINNSPSTTRAAGVLTENSGMTSAGGGLGQGNALVDEGVLENWMQVRRGGTAVGYRPQITLIPSGAGLMAYYTLSGDRRYVKVTPQPMFSQVKKVLTYNLQTGGTSGGGTTGGGMGGGMMGGGLQ